MLKIIKYSAYILLVFIFFVFFNSHVHAYSEHFALPIDESVWSIENNSGLSSLDSWLHFQSVDTSNFPYIYNTSAFPVSVIEPNVIEFEIQFTKVGNFGNGFGIADIPAPPHTPVNSLNSLQNYSLFYIWQGLNSPYLHVVTSLCPIESPNCSGSQLIYSTTTTDLDSHHVKIVENSGYFTFTLDDGVFTFESSYTNRLPLYVWGGHPEVTTNTSSTWSEFKIDYILHNGALAVTFPHYSQLDPIWASDEYDHASTWASEGDREMEEWGCVTSSAAMVLKHFEVNHPDMNEITDPQNLNDWLTGQPDGYVRNGLVNWLAVTRYAHLSEMAGYSTQSLEYVREPYSETSVSGRLAEDPSLPVIVKNTNSHFFPIYDEDGDDWLVSDPLESASSEIAKTTSLVTSNILIPSHTDLSYMMWIIEPGDVLRLYDSAGNLLSTESVIETLGGTGGSGASVQLVYFQQPMTGSYHVEIDNPGGSTDPIEMYFYNQEGEIKQIEDELLAGEKKGWEIDFYKDDSTIVDLVEIDIMAPTTPTLVSPASGALVMANDLILDWIDVSDPSTPVTYNYKSSWTGGSYGPVSTGTNSEINASGIADGTYNWQVQACDSANNCSEWSDPWVVSIDGTAPAKVSGITIKDADGVELGCSGATNKRRVTIDWDDSTESDWNHYLFSTKDNEDFLTLTDSYLTRDIVDLDGEYKYRVKAVDEAGNIGEASEWCEVTLDRLSPSQPGKPATLPNPTNGLLQNWLWSESVDTGSGVNGYYNRVYNVLSGTYLADWLWLGKVLGTSTDLTDGEWQMVVKAEDLAKNESGMASSEVLLVDTVTPVLASKTSLPNTWYNTPQTVTFQYSDLHLLNTYTDPWCEINIESSSSYCYTTPLVSDTAGNCNNTQVFSESIGLDMTEPNVSMSEWGTRISGTASDSLSGVERVEIRLTKPGENESTATAVGTMNWSYTIEPAPVGNYQIYISAYDNAGNVSSEISKNFDINESDPPKSPDVLGESTSSSSSPSPSPALLASFVGESEESPSPSPSVSESPVPNPSNAQIGDVLGESDDDEKSSYWWWLLILLFPGGWWYYKKRISQ